ATTWGVTAAYARGVGVLGLGTGQVAIELPIPTALCPTVADALQQRTAAARAHLGSCRDGVLVVGGPLDVAWLHTEIVTALDGHGSYSTRGVDISETSSSPGTEMTFLVHQPSHLLTWCLSSPLSANSLTIAKGGARYTRRFTGDEPIVPCGSGVRLLVGSSDP